MSTELLLKLQGIKKYFPGVKALDGVDFAVRAGEVHALIGENGAGKSTLVKVLTGIYQPDGGHILMADRPVEFRTPLDSQAKGIAVIQQEAVMFPDLSVSENIFAGHHPTRSFAGFVRWGEIRRRTCELLARIGADIDPDAAVRTLTIAQRHMIEIAKALSIDARIVIMDEPTSALSLREVEELYRIIRQLKSENRAIVFISHKFEEIFEIADFFTVLRDGKYIGEGNVSDADVDRIVTMMVGRSLSQQYVKLEAEQGPTVLKVDHLSATGQFRDVSFELHAGEILGFFGLIGAGRSELMQTLFGIVQPSAGTVTINGEKVRVRGPRDALRKGIAYVPEDRQLQGTILGMNIRENVSLAVLRQLADWIFLNKNNELTVTEEYGKRLAIRAAGWEQIVESLSGGNQQKVVLSKWLATRPKILILDEPTRGIDVATKAEVHRFQGELAQQGMAIIFVSSELPEILEISDNIIVMHQGHITGRFRREEASAETVLKAALAQPKTDALRE